MKRNRYFVVIIVIISVIILAGLLFSLPGAYRSKEQHAISSNNNNNINNNASNNKVVILTFDDGPKNQYTIAKPILDKYGFKATFFIVCNLVGNNNFLNWQEIAALQKEGHDIESHTMNHKDLAKLSSQALEYEVGQSKQCLHDHGINATIFAYPYAEGDSNATVVNTVAKYYSLAKSAAFSLMYLHCDGFDQGLLLYYNKSSQTDCRTYSNDGNLTYANRYDIKSWPHDDVAIRESFNDTIVFNKFVQLLNNQTYFNKNGTINAIPILTYHNIDYSKNQDYHTNVGLFDAEMKYLHDNGFKVLTMNDLGYDENSKYLYVKKISS
jgi:peptidoglycan/xylan/chitin deacetylase (PgdA/CDA1 family)